MHYHMMLVYDLVFQWSTRAPTALCLLQSLGQPMPFCEQARGSHLDEVKRKRQCQQKAEAYIVDHEGSQRQPPEGLVACDCSQQIQASRKQGVGGMIQDNLKSRSMSWSQAFRMATGTSQ